MADASITVSLIGLKLILYPPPASTLLDNNVGCPAGATGTGIPANKGRRERARGGNDDNSSIITQ